MDSGLCLFFFFTLCVSLWTDAFIFGILDLGVLAEQMEMQGNFIVGVNGTWGILVGACNASIKSLKLPVCMCMWTGTGHLVLIYSLINKNQVMHG